MNSARAVAGATIRAAGAISPRWGAAVALPVFGRVAQPRPVTERDLPTMLRARRSVIRIPGLDRHGVDVCAYEWGGGSRTIALAHGWDGRASQFAALVRELVAEGFRVAAFDAPRHGDSGGRRPYLVDWVDALAALQQRRGRFHAVIGHSFGGLAALVGAADAGVAIGRGRRDDVRESMSSRDLPRFETDRVVSIAAPADADALFRQFRAMLGYSQAIDGALRAAFVRRYFAGGDPFAWASAVSQPIPAGTGMLVLHDRDDRMMPFGQSARIAAANPHAHVVATSGLGHNRLLAADQVLDAVLAFVGTETPVRTAAAEGDASPPRAREAHSARPAAPMPRVPVRS